MISFALDDSLRNVLNFAERPDVGVPAVGGDFFMYAEAKLPVKNPIRHVKEQSTKQSILSKLRPDLKCLKTSSFQSINDGAKGSPEPWAGYRLVPGRHA